MSDLRALYQEMIIDHGRSPRNFGPLPNANHHKEGFNPLCGDKIILHVLEKEGVKVRRPDPVDFNYNAKTPFWKSKGFCTASPRDSILIVGDEMIETPMAWRSRYFEVYAYRTLLNEYFDQGARWTAAPKPMLDDKAYDYHYTPPKPGEPMRYMLTEA